MESNGGATITKTGVVYALTSANGNPQIGGNGVTEVDTGSPVNSGAFTVSATRPDLRRRLYLRSLRDQQFRHHLHGRHLLQHPGRPDRERADLHGRSPAAPPLWGATSPRTAVPPITKTGVVYALTSVNGNPQIGGAGVTEVDTGSPVTSGAFTVSATGLSASSGYTFEAFATNSIGTTYTAATSIHDGRPGRHRRVDLPRHRRRGRQQPGAHLRRRHGDHPRHDQQLYQRQRHRQHRQRRRAQHLRHGEPEFHARTSGASAAPRNNGWATRPPPNIRRASNSTPAPSATPTSSSRSTGIRPPRASAISRSSTTRAAAG